MLKGEGQFSRKCIDEALDLLKAVCPIPAPSHNEDRRVDFIMDWLKDKGIEAHVDRAKNVIIPYNDDGVRPLDVFAAHTDVVFPDTTALPMRQEGDILHCPGVADDSANFVAVLMYALEFHRLRPETGNGVLFVCDSCEEGLGNLHGIRTLCEDYGGRMASFTSFDSILGRGIVSTAIGSERYRITVRTAGGHSFADFGSPNAIAQLSQIITKLYGQRTDSRLTTYNVGTVEGGTSVNTIAQEASCTYEFRSSSEDSLDRMRGLFESIISSFRARNMDISVECIGTRPCSCGVDTKALEDVAERLSASYGLSTRRGASSTDCNIPLSLGIPSICFGLIYGEGTHKREEWADLSSYPKGLDLGWDYILAVTGADAHAWPSL